MKRFVTCAVLALVLVGLTQSTAKAAVTMTFEGLQNLEPINDFYNGGTGGFGSGPGPNYGVSFTPDSLAIIAETAGGTGNFSGNPSGDTIAFFLSGSGDTMNVAAGFKTGFSFYYSAAIYPGSVQVYSGLNGTGALLANIALAVTPQNGSSSYTYNNWQPVGVGFGGIAESAIFTGVANYIGFDNITIGAVSAVPEPSTMFFWFAGGVLLVRQLRRRSLSAAEAVGDDDQA